MKNKLIDSDKKNAYILNMIDKNYHSKKNAGSNHHHHHHHHHYNSFHHQQQMRSKEH